MQIGTMVRAGWVADELYGIVIEANNIQGTCRVYWIIYNKAHWVALERKVTSEYFCDLVIL